MASTDREHAQNPHRLPALDSRITTSQIHEYINKKNANITPSKIKHMRPEGAKIQRKDRGEDKKIGAAAG